MASCGAFLSLRAIRRTLGALGGLAPGSEVVLDYMLPADLRDAAVGLVLAERGEPWLSFLSPGMSRPCPARPA